MKERIQSIQWKYILLLSLFPSFTMFIFAPLEILNGIWADVWFDITHVIGLALIMFGVCFLGIVLSEIFCAILFPKALTYFQALIVGLTVALYIQGNFMKTDFGTLDGEAIEWTKYRMDGVLSVLVWIILIAVFLLWAAKKGREKFVKGSRVLIVCLLLTQLVTLITLAITGDMVKIKNNMEYSTKNEFIYSKEDNMIILVLDAYDSQVFDYILNNPEGVDYEQQFENFTYYPDTVGAYSRTYYAIPQMLTGAKYKNQGDYTDYLNDAYRQSPFFKELQELNYSINLYTNEGFPTEKDVYEKIQNYIPVGTNRIEISSKGRMMTYLLKLIGIRYFPVPLKQYCWFYSGELYDVRDLDGYQKVYSVDNHKFLLDSQDMEATSDCNTFHFYHVEGVHSPYCFDKYFNKTGESRFGREAMIEAGRGIFVMVQQFLDELKALGIYDDSVIVIMADHGGQWIEDEGDYLRRHNPLLLVKGKKEEHEFSISQKPISYDDLQEAYVNLLNGVTGEAVFNVEEGESRQRIYINDTDFTEYATNGDAFDYDAMHPTGVIYKK